MPVRGFIDLQVNGYMGVDFSSPSLELEDVLRITEILARAGTAGYCATIITSDLDIYRRNLPLIARAMEQPGAKGRLLGIHIEGPYLSREEGARGSHRPSLMRRPERDEFDRFQEWARGRISILTLAPELEGAHELIAHVCKKYSTRVALGHHLATGEMIARAAEAGASMITHLGNGCPNLLPRHNSIVIHQLANDSLVAGLITDGHHLPEDFIRVVLRCKGPRGVFVVSDSVRIAGFSPGIYQMMGGRVRLTESGKIENLNEPCLAGSSSNMAQCMRFLDSLGILSREELLSVGVDNPLRILGLTPAEIGWTGLPDFGE